jgi:GT2 family glycosyltransferase
MSGLKASIVIPLYNKAPYVRRALDSVAAQTFSDFEVIIVDDGSTDDSASIVAHYPDSRFRLITQPNAGPGAARNTGISYAQGEFIASLDADDEWLPTYLEESLRLLEEFGDEVASISSGYIEYPSALSREKMWRARGIRDGVYRIEPETAPSLIVSRLAYMTPCTTVARTQVINKWKGFYSREKCLFGEDASLWLKVLLNEKVAFSLKPLAKIHTEASGLSNNLRGARPVEPFLKDPGDIEAACPLHLRDVLARVLAIRAAKTACMLGYWGHWREAGALMQRFTTAKNWQLPYYMPALVCSTPVGAILGKTWRGMDALFGR